jgi:hypothetical protein
VREPCRSRPNLPPDRSCRGYRRPHDLRRASDPR